MTREFISKKLPLIGLVLALSLFLASMSGHDVSGDTAGIAEKTSERLSKRLDILDMYVGKTLEKDILMKNAPLKIPEDMVIYHYVNDSLMCWSNQFPLINDDISTKLVFHRLNPVNNRLVSPLCDVTDIPAFINLGSKWYIAKSVKGDRNDHVIAGIEVKNTLIDDISRTDNGVNKNLKLPGKYSVEPLNVTGGSPVIIDGRPLFKIMYNTDMASPFFDSSVLRWFALLLFTLTMLLFLAGHRTFKAYFTVVPTLTILTAIAFIWGLQMNGRQAVFSPNIFADGVFPSLGALLIINTFILIINLCTFFIKGRISQFLTRNESRKRTRLIIYCIGTLMETTAICAYGFLTLRSFILNSNVTLELYKISSNFTYPAVIYLSYTGLALCVLLKIQMLRPAIWEFTGRHYNVLSRKSLVIFAFITSAIFVITSSRLGFHKEEDRIRVWSNRLSVERDLGLEIQLRSVEEGIAGDQLIASLAAMDNTSGVILNRVTEYYLNRTRQAYNIGVMMYKEGDQAGQAILNNIVHTGEPIADGSRFLFISDNYGRSRYAGIFLFYQPDSGLTQMILQVEPDSNKEARGYQNILGQFRQPGDVNIPSFYSYAKYKNGRLSSYKGNFPYPTAPNIYRTAISPDEESCIMRRGGYLHFINRVGDQEIIVISRSQRKWLTFFTSFSYLFLTLSLLAFILPRRKKKDGVLKSNYFKTRINTILFTSSFLILASMAVASIVFVYKRNQTNMFNIMSSKVSTVQGLLENRTRYAKDWNDLTTPAFANALEDIGATTKSDITLYTPGGKVFRSTSPEVFEKLILGSRINEEAFYNIRNRNQRFYIQREKVADYSYWTLYAPLFNDLGEIIAIMNIPFTDRDYDFRKEAFFHAAFIINLFLILLIITLLISTREINAMFSPLIEMGRKMNSADINNLEYIIYKREDEISSLVDAYNRMVKDLSDSTRQLAQAERDKAWSQMARQVAHEIKNPLTPIKLEIQRLIRLKQNNNPRWEEKFDQVAAVVLEHIQILSDTANEFSTFAKLYTEEPVLIDLDKTLKDQLTIFDNRENIVFSYIGLEEAYVMAPRPQLIRVFVNLITNAIQAVEIQQKEAEDKGEKVDMGRILICLRNSTKEGYYDIVFDDNGPGVKGENLDKLFTPNFTTKTGGTGLGLAICRNIIQKCEGEITYQKSFSLNGASFIVTIPSIRKP